MGEHFTQAAEATSAPLTIDNLQLAVAELLKDTRPYALVVMVPTLSGWDVYSVDGSRADVVRAALGIHQGTLRSVFQSRPDNQG